MRATLYIVGVSLALCAATNTFSASQESAEFDTLRDWIKYPDNEYGATQECTVDRITSDMPLTEFHDRYMEKRPVIIERRDTDNVNRFRALTTRHRLLADWGDRSVLLSTANSYSYEKKPVELAHYIREMMGEQQLSVRGNETQYFFGDNDHEEWKALFDEYTFPPYIPTSAETAISFGLAGRNTGVPFHIHGAGYSESVHGRKRWFLYPPDERPSFDPDATTLAWVNGTLPSLAAPLRPMDCVVEEGSVIYFPSNWHHATLNLDQGVFISVFVLYR